MSNGRFTVALAQSSEDMGEIREIFREYEAALGIDLCFQGFEEELANLPGKYAPPHGALLLARDVAGNPIGCVALRPVGGEGVCEMKRLFVRPSGRGMGLGRALAEAIVEEARRIRYVQMRLDTLPAMAEAVALYQSMGFQSIEPYYETPIANTIFLAKALL